MVWNLAVSTLYLMIADESRDAVPSAMKTMLFNTFTTSGLVKKSPSITAGEVLPSRLVTMSLGLSPFPMMYNNLCKKIAKTVNNLTSFLCWQSRKTVQITSTLITGSFLGNKNHLFYKVIEKDTLIFKMKYL